MTILADVFKTLFKMFVADMRLTLATLAAVALVALVLKTGALSPVLSGIVLIVLCVAILMEAVMRETRKRR